MLSLCSSDAPGPVVFLRMFSFPDTHAMHEIMVPIFWFQTPDEQSPFSENTFLSLSLNFSFGATHKHRKSAALSAWTLTRLTRKSTRETFNAALSSLFYPHLMRSANATDCCVRCYRCHPSWERHSNCRKSAVGGKSSLHHLKMLASAGDSPCRLLPAGGDGSSQNIQTLGRRRTEWNWIPLPLKWPFSLLDSDPLIDLLYYHFAVWDG